ncbi:restriction endonuclease subunit S [Sphingobacterium siyangense]|uniref:restriction endonuclease subunit S n=1 Tax=Sphingobacterium siyangense TaxID=459529 RepID=UPI003DA3926C
MEKVLPKGWVETNLKIVSEIIRGVSYKKEQAFSDNFDNSVYILRGGNIQDNKIDFDTDDNIYIGKPLINSIQYVKENDVVIVGSTGSKKLIGKAGIATHDLENVSFGAFLMLLRTKHINKKYHSYFFQTKYYRNSISELAGGVNINNIRKEYLENLIFPLPPLAEQERIVVKLDKLFSQHEKIKKALDRIPRLLKDFRQQVLTYAVTGKLTEQWREGKEMQIDYKSIDEYLKNFKRFKPIDQNAEPSEIPKTWHNVKMGNVSYVSNGSTPSRSVKEYWGGNIAWIGSSQIQNNKIKLAKEFITNKGLENSSIRILPKGTVLIAMIGEGKTRAQSSILKIQATINQNVASIEIGHSQIVPEYLQYFLIKNYDLHRTIGNGTGPKALNCQRVKEFDFQLPPLQEQQEIVRRVESLFAKADTIESRYQTLKAKIDNLPQAILHKAFKGELVSQLPTDGDAKDLLAEIMALKKDVKKKGKA